jgi:hypothetical protein
MPFVLLIVGLLMIITGARGTYAQFGSQLASEFEGTNNFTYQMIALGAVGALGYIPALQTISRWALALILLVILLSNKNSNGFYSEFQAALQNGPTAPQPVGNVSTITPSNPSGGPTLNFGPLGTLNLNPIDPNGPIGETWSSFLGLFGQETTATPTGNVP